MPLADGLDGIVRPGFFDQMGIKPLMHLLEIITFSLNNVIVRLTNPEQSRQKLGTFLINKVL